MDDLISRQEALKAVGVNSWAGFRINALPSTQRTGRWIIKENPGTEWYGVTCSACGEDVSSVIPTIGFFPNVKALWDFCPNCGARMEKDDNG